MNDEAEKDPNRKSRRPPDVSQDMRYLLMIALVAALIWLGSLLWQMLQGTGNVF